MIFNKTALAIGVASTLIFASCTKQTNDIDDNPVSVNTAPTASPYQTNNSLIANAKDIDNDTLSYVWSIDGNDIGTTPIIDITNLLTSYNGIKTVLIKVSDGQETITESLIVNFGEATTSNTAPTISNAIFNGTSLVATATDNETPNNLTYTWSVNSVVIGSGSSFSIANAPSNIEGVQNVNLVVSDGSLTASSNIANVDFGVTDTTNETPVIVSASQNGDFLNVTATDAETASNLLTYTWKVGTTILGYGDSININSAPTNIMGVNNVTIEVSDGNSVATGSVTGVDFGEDTQENTAPTVGQIIFNNGELSVNATDNQTPNSLTYAWSVAGNPVAGNASSIDASTFTGTQNVSVRVSDAGGLFTDQSASIVFSTTNTGSNPDVDIIDDSKYDGNIPLKQKAIGNVNAPLQTTGNPFADSYFYLSPDIKIMMDYSLDLVETSNDPMASLLNYNKDQMIDKIKYIQRQPSAVWMDSIAAIDGDLEAGRRSLKGHLDAAIAQQEFYEQQDSGIAPMTVVVIIYNLPDRDCAAFASAGQLYEIGKPQESYNQDQLNGLQRYKNEYITPIVNILSDSKYDTLRIVAMLEPDSYPNMITNTHASPNGPSLVLSDEGLVVPGQNGPNPPENPKPLTYCDTLLAYQETGLEEGLGVYGRGLQIAIEELYTVGDNMYTYLDIAHSGWLGWNDAADDESNLKRGVDGFLKLINGANSGGVAGTQKVRGFASNTSNYTPIEEPLISNDLADREELADFYEWNQAVDEVSYLDEFYNRIMSVQSGFDPGFIIDTARNGWGKDANRPALGSGEKGTDLDSRIDKRVHRGHWCNIADAGVGEVPKANPDHNRPYLDAFFWMKPPGESDGISFDHTKLSASEIANLDNVDKDVYDSASKPVYDGKTLDSMCIAGSLREGGDRGIVTTPVDYKAPHAGAWFHKQFIELIDNAYPPLGESEYD